MAISDVQEYTPLTDEEVEQLGRELDAVRAEIEESRGDSDAAYINRLIRIQRYLAVAGRITLLVGTQGRRTRVPAAVAGATLLAHADPTTARVGVAVILLGLGAYVTWRFLVPQRLRFAGRLPARFLAPVGLVAGVLDAVGGGGWGPVGTSSMLSSGRLEPRKVVGSVDTAEFVVTVGASLGFLLALGTQGVDWAYAAALLVGGVLAAPVAAVVVRYLPARVLGVAAGGLIVLTNGKTLADAAGVEDVTTGLLASVTVTLWVLWISWAVKLDQAEREGGVRRPGDLVAAKVE